jgi:hypothetical protein
VDIVARRGREARDERLRAFLFQTSRPVECKAYSTGVSVSAFQLFFAEWIVDMVARRGASDQSRESRAGAGDSING